MTINNISSGFDEIISGVPQGSMVGLTSFNVFLDDFFHYFENEAVHNIADDNTLSCFAETINGLIILLQVESEVAIKWIYKNKMIINLENSYQ